MEHKQYPEHRNPLKRRLCSGRSGLFQAFWILNGGKNKEAVRQRESSETAGTDGNSRNTEQEN
jgi:hypothetical protein